MSKKRRVIAFIALGMVSALLTVSVVALMRVENVLERTAKNIDTITIDATYNHTDRTLEATQLINYRNRSGMPKTQVMFHIWANAFREGAVHQPISAPEMNSLFPNGRDTFGDITIHGVYVAYQRVMHGIIGEDENVLSVPLPRALMPNQYIDIEIIYTVRLAGLAHRLGYTDRVVNLGNFYPVPVMFDDGVWMTNVYSYNGDPFFNAVHNFHVTLTKPANFIMASSGTVIKTTTSGATRTTVVESKAIRDWAAVLSPYLQSLTRVVDRIAVNYYFLDDRNPARSLETSVRSLQTFSRLFIPYPFRQLTVVQTDFLHGGMEFGEIVFISTSITEREEIDRVIIHEIAHQWWYGIVGNDQYRTAWIDEGLAEYSTLLFYDENPDMAPPPRPGSFAGFREDYINMFRNNFATYTRLVHSIGGVVNTEMNRPLTAFNTTYEYVYMAYVRGMLLFVDLERMIGRDRMIVALSTFARENMFGIATQASITEIFERKSGARLGLFFESYLSGTVSLVPAA